MAAVGATPIFAYLTILLTLATLSHFFIKRFHQPTIVGEIAIGVLIGPSLFGYLNIFQFDPVFVTTFAELGAIFLLFLIGLESDFRAIYTRKNFFVAFGGVVLPLALGFVAAFFLAPPSATSGDRFLMALFVGATLTATSTAIAASVLLDLGLMKEPVAQTIMGAAVVDDILGLVLLSVVVGMSGGGLSVVHIILIIVGAVAFIVIGIYLGLRLFNPIVVRLQVDGMKLGLKHGGFIIAMAIAFFYSLVAESVGSAIIGAFLAGSMFASTPLKEDFAEGASYLGAIFTPIFFISLGLQVNLETLGLSLDWLIFGIVLAVVAVATKVIGCGLAARLQSMSRSESVAVGWGMTPRGEVGLIVAVTALSASVISTPLFSAIVLVIIVVSVAPAPFFKRALNEVDEDRRSKAAAASAPAESKSG